MIVIQNDIQASERSMEALHLRLQQGHRVALDKIDLEDLVQSVLAIGQKLIYEPKRLAALNLPEVEFEQAENEWSDRMHAAEKLAVGTLSLIAEYESRGGIPVDGYTELKKTRKHLNVINTFTLEDIREARLARREGRIIPLSAIKNAL